MAEKEGGTAVEKKEYLMNQHKQANTLMICDMIRLQIHLKSVLSGLKASPKVNGVASRERLRDRD
jgi:hypothetical protein